VKTTEIIYSAVYTWYKDAFWSIESEVDEGDTYPYTPGVLIRLFNPLSTTSPDFFEGRVYGRVNGWIFRSKGLNKVIQIYI